MIGQDIGPFLFEGSDIGCLLIHGFTNTPHEMRGMGNYLAERGWGSFWRGTEQAAKILLARPGTLAWHDWVASAEEAVWARAYEFIIRHT